jgi:predicted Rossmann fold flavoprotein
MNTQRVIVIGAGASGMMAAGRAAACGAEVLLLEKMEQPGKKILVSGKSRCNLTNSKELEDFIQAFGPNGRFLYPAFKRFFRDDLIDFLKKLGVETKTERGGRVFPSSDDARDIVAAFGQYLKKNRVKLQTVVKVQAILTSEGKVTGVKTDQSEYPCGAIILATGGASWPATGSTGEGYRMAAALGHTIIKLRPALVPLVVEETDLVKSMQGVSLKNVTLTAFRGDSTNSPQARKYIIDSRLGEMMLTHFGLGGPITLLMSRKIVDALGKVRVSVSIDLKPGLSNAQLQARLQSDFDTFSKKDLQNILKELLPLKLIDPIISLSGIDPAKKGNQLNAKERDRLVVLLKCLRFNIKGPLPLTSAMVTAGGVSLKEIDPRTMASRLWKGLYFCGEVMDIDADTGGYNLQAAFSTGFVAGESAATFTRNSV